MNYFINHFGLHLQTTTTKDIGRKFAIETIDHGFSAIHRDVLTGDLSLEVDFHSLEQIPGTLADHKIVLDQILFQVRHYGHDSELLTGCIKMEGIQYHWQTGYFMQKGEFYSYSEPDIIGSLKFHTK